MPALFFCPETMFIMYLMLTYLRPYMQHLLQMLLKCNKHTFANIYGGYTAALFHFNNIQMQFFDLGQWRLFYHFIATR